MIGAIFELLFCRRPSRAIGLCQGCRTTVRMADDWCWFGIGVAHRECAEYVGHRRRRPPARMA